MKERRKSIRSRFFWFFGLITLSLGLGSLYIYLSANLFLGGMVTLFQRNRNLLELDDTRALVSRNLEDYLGSNNSDSLLAFWTSRDALQEEVRRSLQAPLSQAEYRVRRTVAELLESFLRAAEESLEAKRGRDFSRYARAFGETERITQLLQWYIAEENLGDFRASIERGSAFFQEINNLFSLNLMVIFSLMGLTALWGFWISLRLTEPLSQLTLAAEAFAQGDYSGPELPGGQSREIQILSQAFGTMRTNILNHIAELKEKAQVEQGLMQEQVKNLEISTLLMDAEFRALQAQINPHFLFNALNAGIQLALMEGADQTRRYMESLSAFMRYTVRGLDKPVQLRDELRHLEHYFFIQRIRFGDRYHLEIQAQGNCPDFLCPGMILQPLVENALMHGLKDRLEGGRVLVRLDCLEDRIRVSVEDNGTGVPQDVREALLAGTERSRPQGATESTGIGLSNVLGRIDRFFSGRSQWEIHSSPGEGTRIVLEFPQGHGPQSPQAREVNHG